MTEFYLAVFLFAIATTITPGPNTIMLMASGINHGVRKSIPHYLGVCLGFPVLIAVMALGLGTIFIKFPFLHAALKYIGVSYLIYLAWIIANTVSFSSKNETRDPLTFLQAVAFQWVNPKAWVISIGVIAAYTTPTEILDQTIFIIFSYLVVGFACMGVWLFFGAAMQRFIRGQKQLKLLNVSMALLLVASVVPILFSGVG